MRNGGRVASQRALKDERWGWQELKFKYQFQDGDLLTTKQLQRKWVCSPGREYVEHETAVFPTANEGQPHLALYSIECNQQDKESYYSLIFGTCETTSGMLCPVLNVPIEQMELWTGKITWDLESVVSIQYGKGEETGFLGFVKFLKLSEQNR